MRYKTWAQAERSKFYSVCSCLLPAAEKITPRYLYLLCVFENTRGVWVWATSGEHLELVIQEQVLRNTECFGSSFIPITATAPCTPCSRCGKTIIICIRSLKVYHPMWSICQNKLINYLQGNKASQLAASTRHWNTKSNSDWSCFFNMLL